MKEEERPRDWVRLEGTSTEMGYMYFGNTDATEIKSKSLICIRSYTHLRHGAKRCLAPP